MTERLAAGIESTLAAHFQSRLERLYGEDASEALPRLLELLDRFRCATPDASPAWDETETVLITYGDAVSKPGAAPLATLREFLLEQNAADWLSSVHILPFCPSSSDDGFSVIDYLQVDPELGDWDDLATLGEHFRLMFDLVLNHCSAESDWFASYIEGEPPYDQFFIEADPERDYSEVVRPRSLPLLTPVETSRGLRYVWTTFSADQVDLNYASPDVLLTMLEVLLEYAARGAAIVRLDAIAFLWKTLGTSCVHLPETHEIVKLMRDALEATRLPAWLLTETNVPHNENVSYFGNGDESQMVYQFPLPPLLLDAFVHGDATYFNRWLASLQPPQPGTTYLNFTASHDGIGVRPLEGLVPDERVDSLVAAVRARDGLVSTRRRGERDVPYELNITYVDALAPEQYDAQLHAERFLASQAVMLALQGIPAVYFPSLVGTQNDQAGVEASGAPRRINRHKFAWDELEEQIADHPLSAAIYQGYRRMLKVRRQSPAFHPDAVQKTFPSDNPLVIAFQRTSQDESQRILVVANVGEGPTTLDLTPWNCTTPQRNLLSDLEISEPGNCQVPTNTTLWLVAL